MGNEGRDRADPTGSIDEQVDWAGLLSYVRSRSVIPVVGQHLLEVEVGAERVSLDGWIAARLAERLRIPAGSLPAAPTLRDVWARAEEIRGARAALFPAVRGIVERADLPEPRALAQLAAITDLPLFVSATVDPALERALARVRGATPSVLCIDPGRPREPDLTSPDMPSSGATVFAMLGRILSGKPYAVTDREILERVTLLLQHDKHPPNLFSVLGNSNLLLLGCGFPDWLARFVVRGLRDAPLDARSDLLAYLVEARADPDLVLFLENNNLRCLLSPGGPGVFVEELHRKWLEGRPPQDDAGAGGPEPAAATPGGVFLSYAREDKDRVDELARYLDAAGVPLWVDSRSLHSGDNWDARIKEAISRCDAFVACASRNVAAQDRSYLYKEWDLALETAKEFAPGERFVFPVALDQVDVNEPHLASLKPLHWRFLAGEDPPAAREALRKDLDLAVKKRRMKGRFT